LRSAVRLDNLQPLTKSYEKTCFALDHGPHRYGVLHFLCNKEGNGGHFDPQEGIDYQEVGDGRESLYYKEKSHHGGVTVTISLTGESFDKEDRDRGVAIGLRVTVAFADTVGWPPERPPPQFLAKPAVRLSSKPYCAYARRLWGSLAPCCGRSRRRQKTGIKDKTQKF
jgi:hypothetical protein